MALRLSIAVDSGEALQQINEVKKTLARLTEAREHDLSITRTNSRLEVAEYNSMIAAQKAYQKEIELAGAIKRQAFRIENGADQKEIDEMTSRVAELRGEYVKLEAASVQANINAANARKEHLHALAKEDLGDFGAGAAKSAIPQIKGATKATSELGGQIKLTNILAREMGLAVRAGSGAAMLQYAIIIKGLESWKKVIGQIIRSSEEQYRIEQKIADANTRGLAEATDRIRSRIEAEQEYLDVLRDVSAQDDISYSAIRKQEEAIKVLTRRYGDLGAQIDENTGRLKNYADVAGKIAERQRQSEIRALQNERDDLQRRIEDQQERTNTSWWEVLPGFKGDATLRVQDAEKEIDKLSAERTRVNRRLAALQAQNPIEEAQQKQHGDAMDARQQFIDRIEQLRIEGDIARLRKEGTEAAQREADALMISAKYDKERLKYLSNTEALKAFDLRREEMEDYERRLLRIQREENRAKSEKPQAIEKRSKSVRDVRDEIRLPSIRETAVSAVSARSVEGVRLMSRDFGLGRSSENLDVKRNSILEEVNRNIKKLVSHGGFNSTEEVYSYGE
ncbi:MAG: hypothetical protein MJ016_00945 [Victivallaceae bacterium]|nr:hypothetical protein [Victivallaceae bacterium]